MAQKLNVSLELVENPSVRCWDFARVFRIVATNTTGKVMESKLSGMVMVRAMMGEINDVHGTKVQRPALRFHWSPTAVTDRVYHGIRQAHQIRTEEEWAEILKEHPRAARDGAEYCPEPLTVNGKVYLAGKRSDMQFYPEADARAYGPEWPEARVLGMRGVWVFSGGNYDTFSDAARETLRLVAEEAVKHFTDAAFADYVADAAVGMMPHAQDHLKLWKLAEDAVVEHMNAAAELRAMVDSSADPMVLGTLAQKVDVLRKKVENAFFEARRR